MQLSSSCSLKCVDSNPDLSEVNWKLDGEIICEGVEVKFRFFRKLKDLSSSIHIPLWPHDHHYSFELCSTGLFVDNKYTFFFPFPSLWSTFN